MKKLLLPFSFLLVILNTAFSQNLVQNPSFDSGNISPWTGAGLTSATRARTAPFGAYIANGQTLEQTITGLVAGATYELKGWVWPRGTGANVQLGVKNFGGTTVEVSEPTSAAYVQKTLQFTVGAGASSATIYYKRSDAGFSWCHLDDVELVKLTPTYSISLNATGCCGAVAGNGTFVENTNASVMATPESGFAFVNWTENGNVVSTNATYTFSLTANRNLTATFQNATKNYIGIGINSAKDFEEGPFIFADAMKHARQWKGLDDNQAASVDALGNPTEPAEVIVSNSAHLDGVYKLCYVGKATTTIKGGTISNINYNDTTNTTTATVTVTNTAQFYLYVKFTAITTPVSQIRLMRPMYPGASQAYPDGTVFTSQIIGFLKRFNSVRYMDLLATNSDTYHTNTSWATRTTPNYATQSVAWNIQTYQANNPATNKAWYKYQGKGVAWEYVILLANTTNTDAWINIPHAADDDYITKIAQAFKFGTDGTNPYTSPQTNPVFPPLNANLKLYIEYSNEVWNTGFPVNPFLGIKVQQEPANSDIRYDNTTQDKFLRYRWAARRTLQISETFRGVFGNDQMMTRIRPLYEWQKGQNNLDVGNTNRTGTIALKYIEDVYGSQHPVDYYLYGGGCSGYYQANSPTTQGATIENLWTEGEFDPAQWAYPKQEWSVYITSAYGLKRAVYEGGPSFGDQNGASGINNLAPTALQDTRIKNEIIEHQNAYSQVGGELFTFFVAGGDERWGFMQGHTDTLSYKMQGIDAIKDQIRPDVVTGYQVNGNAAVQIWGKRWKLTNKDNGGWNPNNTAEADSAFIVTQNAWYSYHFNTERNGTYKVRVHFQADSAGIMEVYLGVTKLGTINVSNTSGSTIVSSTFDFQGDKDNVQAIRIKSVGGKFTVVNVEIGKTLATTNARKAATSTFENPTVANKPQMRLFPNPVLDNHLNVNMSGLEPNAPIQISMLNMQGQAILNQIAVTDFTGEVKTELSLPSNVQHGMYIIWGRDTKNTVSQKLLIRE